MVRCGELAFCLILPLCPLDEEKAARGRQVGDGGGVMARGDLRR
jgi:hypothetical protein